MTEFSEFLLLGPNGRVWWRLEDAFRLGAGFTPQKDDQQNLTSKLVAPDNRAKANERGLLGAYHDKQNGIDAPQVARRGDGNFVSAQDFLLWLGEYLLNANSSMAFPAELARNVDNAEQSHYGKKAYQSWQASLVGLVDSPFASLPSEMAATLREDIFPFDWDVLAPDQRVSWAIQWDARHDPARAGENQFWWRHHIRQSELEAQIAEWESKKATSVLEQSAKEARLVALKTELSGMKKTAQQTRALLPETANTNVPTGTDASTPRRFVPYPVAMRRLKERLDATPDELAMWVFYGAGERGGINAYVNANELNPPDGFAFLPYNGDNADYLRALMGSWFDEAELAKFAPNDRYITGRQLLERWSEYPDLIPSVDGFIAAKISETRLEDGHPVSGFTQWTNLGDMVWPQKDQAVFSLKEVERIEIEDGLIEAEESRTPPGLGRAVSDVEIMQAFRMDADEKKNKEWWSKRMRDAKRYGLLSSRAQRGRPGIGRSSRWWPSHVAGWLVDKEHINAKKVADSLRQHFPDCIDAADLLDPS